MEEHELRTGLGMDLGAASGGRAGEIAIVPVVAQLDSCSNQRAPGNGCAALCAAGLFVTAYSTATSCKPPRASGRK